MFLILIAVALFGALSYAATSSTRSGGGSITNDTDNLRASQIIQHANFISNAMLRMSFKGVTEDEFCFDHDSWGHNDYDHAGCADLENHIFLPDGGGVSWVGVPEISNDGSVYYFPANLCVPGIGENVDADCENDATGDSVDIILILPNVTKNICLLINEKLGVTNPGGEPPKDGGNVFAAGQPYFAGTFTNEEKIDTDGSDSSILFGRDAGCVESNGTPPAGNYQFFYVLYPR